ncbi:hypothetical protein PV306_33540 [Pseudomonas aeruginosa]|uniref:hypothetical protein n=1 Tax=Pseudomonas aeruginosa TaxID=287 RepID=UPI0030A2F40E
MTCDVCRQSTSVEGYGQQFGTLQAHWGYGSKHDGERYKVHLCELWFFRTLSGLRRERMVNAMFDEEPDSTKGLYAGIPEISVSPAPVPPRAHPGR